MEKFNGITSDSRLVKKGFAFVAIKGKTVDGHNFINDAKKRGASYIYDGPDGREKLGELASEFYGNPSQKLKIIGVTGTKGKTTTCHLVYHILTTLGHKTGLITSITAEGFHTTTPDVVSLNKDLAEMVKNKYEYTVLEVSSHGIDQKRIAGVKFDVGVLTNIAPEHLDYHKTFKEYKRVKMSFINSCKYKVIAPTDTNLDVLPGLFNNLNVEAAVKAVEFFGIKREEALNSLKTFKLPEGRLEEIKNNLGIKIIVDFAHTPDSLKAALKYLRTQTSGKLFSVFGCASERDIKKRRKMGKISGILADTSIFTVEDSRFENINHIFYQMKKDLPAQSGNKNAICIPERGEAIVYALSIAKKGDTVGIFGKGHEKSLSYKGFEHPWSDQEAVRDYLNAHDDVSVVILAAGKGTRMQSKLPKVVHEICGRPMIAYTLENLRKAEIKDIVTVVSFRKNLVINKIHGAVKIAFQKNPKGGTADAAKTGFKLISQKSRTLVVINGDDSAFYTPETIRKIIEVHNDRNRKLTFVSLMKEDPTGLGRVIRRADGLISKIVEEKDATPDERKIKEVNDGLYVFDKKWFTQNIDKVKKGPQGEFYLVDLVKMAIDKGDRMATYTLPNDDEWHGINTKEQLAEAENKMKARLKLNAQKI